MKKWIVVVLICSLLLAGCNYPTPEENPGAEETSIAKTVDAEVTEDVRAETPTTKVEKTEPAPTEDTGDEDKPTETPKATATPDGGDEIGEGDMAEFITDVTIPDYSELETGDEITKTWRVKNTGSTTWTADYVIEFEKGEKLGASTQIPLGEEVAPGKMVDISIDFTVPSATGEYTSYWI
ncbi:MAG: NBR1-Ig-like domain-containing protein, partial [Anaerolineales bacterium]